MQLSSWEPDCLLVEHRFAHISEEWARILLVYPRCSFWFGGWRFDNARFPHWRRGGSLISWHAWSSGCIGWSSGSCPHRCACLSLTYRGRFRIASIRAGTPSGASFIFFNNKYTGLFTYYRKCCKEERGVGFLIREGRRERK
jgi:hypothetical protein